MRYLIIPLILMLAIVGCSGSGAGPLTPKADGAQEAAGADSLASAPRLWGLWNIEYDFQTGMLQCTPLRTADTIWNVTGFLQPPAGSLANLGVSILDKSNLLTQGRIDVRVTIHHPLPSAKFRGFDVRGVVMGNGSIADSYNPDVKYPGPNDLRLLNADGYTRWMNKSEFQTQGMLGFIPGALGSKSFSPSATINGYKYFSELIDTSQSVYDYFASSPAYVSNRGSMTPGTGISRDYQLEFPTSPLQVKFQYAVIAGWEKATSGGSTPSPLDFPLTANAFEPVALSVVDSSTLYYESATSKGGNIDLKLDIVDWWANFDPGHLADHISKIILSSDSITLPGGGNVAFDFAALTQYGTSASNTEAVNISLPDCVPSGTDNQRLLIAIETKGYDYSNPYGVTNLAGSDPLTGYFIHTFNVSPEFNDPPVVTSGVDGPSDVFITDLAKYTVTAVDPDSATLTYEWTVKDPLIGALLYGPNPGTAPGSWTLDWGAADLPGTCEVRCVVSDGDNFTEANPLTVNVNDTVFHADLNNITTGDNIGWTKTAHQGVTQWTNTVGADDVLQGFGYKFGPFKAQYLKDSADILVSPEVSIPPAIDRAIMVVTHSYDFEYYDAYQVGFDGGNIKITEAPTLPAYDTPEEPILGGKNYDGWLFDTAIDNQMAFDSHNYKNDLEISALEIPPAFIGSSVHMSFAAATNYFDYEGNHGWLIDDVQVRAMPAAGNAPPIPGGSVTGGNRALLLSEYPGQYQVIGYDLEDDPLTYQWTIREPGTGAILYGPLQDPDTGMLTLDWTTAVSGPGHYEVHVSIYDGKHPGVPAPPLDVLVQKPVYHSSFSDTTTGDNAGWSAILESGTTTWTANVGADSFLQGFGYKWGEFGVSYTEDSQGILLSPPIQIPSGITSASIYILHDFQFLAGLDGGNVKLTQDPVVPGFATSPQAIAAGYGYDVKLAGTVMNSQDAFGIGAGGGKQMLSRIDIPWSMFGHKIRLGFAVASGTTFFNERGWLIDDVAIATVP